MHGAAFAINAQLVRLVRAPQFVVDIIIGAFAKDSGHVLLYHPLAGAHTGFHVHLLPDHLSFLEGDAVYNHLGYKHILLANVHGGFGVEFSAGIAHPLLEGFEQIGLFLGGLVTSYEHSIYSHLVEAEHIVAGQVGMDV